MSKGIVFDIERYATQDGPGIRTVVFLKGCPLRCQWCANPESQLKKPQVMYYQSKCSGCGRCIENCPVQAIQPDAHFGLLTVKEKCTGCQKCVDLCYYDARKLMGTEMTVDEVMKVVLRDRLFYQQSGGGVTLSGGEPLLQPHFAQGILERCKEEGWHTAIETCGYVPWDNFKGVVDNLDLIFYDLKFISPVLHKKYTGVENDRVMINLKKLDVLNKHIICRVPVIPGCNDNREEQAKIYKFVSTLPNVQRIEVLPYHRLGMAKYRGLGRKYDLDGIEPVDRAELMDLIELGQKYGVAVQLGPELSNSQPSEDEVI